jgi:chromosome partitioning protein
VTIQAPTLNPKIVSVVNLKGGVGKTALAVNFAAYCGSKGRRTLLIDMDPQTNATFSCMDIDEWEKHAQSIGTVASLLGFRAQAQAEARPPDVLSIIRKAVFPGVDLIPSHLDLFTIDLDLGSATGRELKLRKAIQPILPSYDIVVCDCPPNLTIPTQNALAASSHYVVPISPDYLSGIGVGILLKRVRKFCYEMDHTLVFAGIVISRVGRPAIHRAQTVNALREAFGADVLSAQIAERVAVSEAAAEQKSVFQKGGQAAAEFADMSKELLERLEN